jgi:Skp family chaperone for outer membrane proteins
MLYWANNANRKTRKDDSKMKSFALVFVTVACLGYVGCDRVANPSNGPVAVVDLDAVAQKLGRDKQILQLIEQRQVSLNEQLASAQNSLIQQLNQKKNEFGDLSDEESKQLVQLQNQANTIIATTRTQAQSNLSSFQQEVVNRFRAETKPIVMELAAKKGCRVVLSKNDSVVFAFDATVDLTDEVAAAMQAKGSSSPSPAAQVKQAAAQTNTKKL